MLKHGFVATLATVALALASVSAYAEAPVVNDLPDVIIGDLEQGDANNVFIFPDAISLAANVTDDSTADNLIKWSYLNGVDDNILINGAAELSGVDPTSPLAGEDLNLTNLDTPIGDALADTITFRNMDLTTVGGVNTLNPGIDPGVNGIVTSQTRVLALFASDGTTYSQADLVVYTANNTSDSLSQGGVDFTDVIDLDFENDPNDRSGWLGGSQGGAGTTSFTTGLCLTVPFGFESFSSTVWISPGNFTNPGPNMVALVDKGLYKATATLMTTTVAPSAIPYVDFVYDNLVSVPGTPVTFDGNTYGGLYWLLDVAGGATGVGRFQSDFNLWVTPNAVLTQQWRGVIDAANGAFHPSVDFKNDWKLTMRIIHSNPSIFTQNDGGTICMRRLKVTRCDIDDVTFNPLQNAPIISYTDTPPGIFFRNPDDFGAGFNSNGIFQIAGGECNMTLRPNPAAAGAEGRGARKQLLYQDDSVVHPPESFLRVFFPILWERGKVYATRVGIRSNVGGPSGNVEGTDPLDAIFVDFATPQSEVGAFHFTSKGSNGNFLRAASPRLLATTGTAQEYIGFWEGTEPSKAPSIGISFDGSDRFRGYIDMFNTGAILGTITDGLDAVTITSVSIEHADNL